MKVEIGQKSPSEGDLQRLGDLLERECAQYRRLLRLAWRQNSYMKRQDVDRLEANAAEWNRFLPLAAKARSAREKYLAALGAVPADGPGASAVTELLKRTGSPQRVRIRRLLGEIRETVIRLARQNELNRALAAFCIDLAREESEIFRRSVLDDPFGCYDGDARKADRGPGGVLVKQA